MHLLRAYAATRAQDNTEIVTSDMANLLKSGRGSKTAILLLQRRAQIARR